MKNLTPELIEKAKAAKSVEEFLEIAKANGVEMTAEEAKEYYNQIASCELDDDLLYGVSGGTGGMYETDETSETIGTGVIIEPTKNTVSTARPANVGICR